MDDFSLARPAGHLIMGDGSGPDGLAKKDGAKALSGAASVDTATTQVDKPSRTKNLIIELKEMHARELLKVSNFNNCTPWLTRPFCVIVHKTIASRRAMRLH